MKKSIWKTGIVILLSATSLIAKGQANERANETNHIMDRKNNPLIVRISIGHFQPEQLEAVAQKLMESEAKLRSAIEKLEGNIAYYVAIDKEKYYMTNVSIWKTLKNAQQMDTLKEMKDLRKEFEPLKIEFMPITNHETLWAIQR